MHFFLGGGKIIAVHIKKKNVKVTVQHLHFIDIFAFLWKFVLLLQVTL